MPTHTDLTALDVGTPPSSGDEKGKSVKLLFHRFGELSAERGQCISSPEFECNGRKWCALLYPRGSTDASEGYVSIYLKLRFEGSCAVTFEITSIKVDGSSLRKFADTYTLHNQKNWGWHNFIKRSDILDESRSILDSNGTFAVMISMKEELANVQPFVPRNDFNCMMRGLFLDEETSDICFEVGATDVEEGNFHAHRLVLKKCAPMLVFDSFNTLDGEEMARLVITDVEPKVFRRLLAYVYGGTVPKAFLKEQPKDFINAAD
jgi:speckle-type POZ protein